MGLIQNFLNKFRKDSNTWVATENKEQKVVKDPAVVMLNNIKLDELIVQAEALENWLNSCGGLSLKQINKSAPIPMTANIFALLGGFIDLLTVVQHPQEDKALERQQIAYLTMNLIGLLPVSADKAPALMALRPMLAHVASKKFKDPHGWVDKATYVMLQQHLNDKLAGDLEKFLEQAKSELSQLITESANLATAWIADLSLRATKNLSSTGLDVLGLGKLPNLGSKSENYILRDPSKQIINWAEPLNQLLQIKKANPVAPKNLELSPALLKNLESAGKTLSAKILEQQSQETFTVTWVLDEMLHRFKDLNNLSTLIVGVPVSYTGEHKGKQSGGTLEYMSLQPDAINNPLCGCANEGTGNRINYALGTEQISHADFIIYGKYPLQLARSYQSQRVELDDSEFGARWCSQYSKCLKQVGSELLFIDQTGRVKKYPSLMVDEQLVDYELGHIVERLSEKVYTISYGQSVLETYELTAIGSYRLAMIAYLEEDLTLGIRYDQRRKTLEGAQTYGLSHLILKKQDQILIQIEALYQHNHIAKLIEKKQEGEDRVLAQYEYDKFGNLIKAIDEDGHQREYQYNGEFHQLTRYTDRTGRGQNIRYENTSPHAKAIEEWRDDGSLRTRLVWDKQIRKVSVYDAHDVPTHYYFDLDGMTYRIVYADGLEEWTQRNQNQQITKQTERSGSQSLSYYNDQQQPIEIIDANHGVTHFQYDENALLTAIRDTEGGIWQREYDQNLRLSATIDPLGRKTAYQYDQLGMLNSIIDAKGGQKKISYNALGQMTEFTDCSGKTTKWEYDERGRLLSVTDALNQITQYQYATEGEQKGQLSKIIFPDGKIETYRYDAEGRLLAVGDGKKELTRYQYNRGGLITSRTSLGQTLRYEWDLRGQLTKLINANGAEFVFKYDQMGRLIYECGFDGVERHFQYDANTGRLYAIRTDTISSYFKYDAKGNVLQRWFEDANGVVIEGVSFAYNSKDQLLSAENAHSKIDYYYDLAGQMLREHQHYLLEDQHYVAIWQYQYDALGNLETTIRPDGQQVSHLIYGSGHVYGIAINQQEIVGFERDDLHREVKRYYGNNLILESQFDVMGRLVRQNLAFDQQQALQHGQFKPKFETHRAYQYSQDGLLTTIQDQRRGVLRYDYDELGRLTKAVNGDIEERFAFDPAGNILDPLTGQSKLETLQSNDAPQHMQTEIQVSQSLAKVMNDLVTDYMGTKYVYDQHGNVIEKHDKNKIIKFEWNALNQLTSVLSDPIKTDYIYDIFGRRIAKHSQYYASHTSNYQEIQHQKEQQQRLFDEGKLGYTLFGWQGEQLAWESDLRVSLTAKTTHYIYEPDSVVPLAQVQYTQAIGLVTAPDYDALIAQGYDIAQDPLWNHQPQLHRPVIEQIAYYHCDQLGTPQELTDRDGQLLWNAHYKAWGEAEVERSERAKHLHIDNYHRYQGQYFDAETGLHYNRFRYYDPHLARYISRDPIGLNGGMNLNAYVPNPNQWIDPLGLAQFGIYNLEGEFKGVSGSDQGHLNKDEVYVKYNSNFDIMQKEAMHKIRAIHNPNYKSPEQIRAEQEAKERQNQRDRYDSESIKRQMDPNYRGSGCLAGHVCPSSNTASSTPPRNQNEPTSLWNKAVDFGQTYIFNTGTITNNASNLPTIAEGYAKGIQHIKTAPVTSTGGIGTIARGVGTGVTMGISVLDAPAANGVAYIRFNNALMDCYNSGKCDEDSMYEIKRVASTNLTDAWEMLNNIRYK